jgi:hypothetical protein
VKLYVKKLKKEYLYHVKCWYRRRSRIVPVTRGSLPPEGTLHCLCPQKMASRFSLVTSHLVWPWEGPYFSSFPCLSYGDFDPEYWGSMSLRNVVTHPQNHAVPHFVRPQTVQSLLLLPYVLDLHNSKEQGQRLWATAWTIRGSNLDNKGGFSSSLLPLYALMASTDTAIVIFLTLMQSISAYHNRILLPYIHGRVEAH